MTTYYVSNTGHDTNNNGLSEGAPWLTIAKVNASTFSAGDSILFKRGNTWLEQLTVPSSGSDGSPITFGAYGTGEKPIISASIIKTGFIKVAGNLYSVAMTTDPKCVIRTDRVIAGENKASSVGCGAEGDWWWDNPNKILYLYCTGNPNDLNTEIYGRAQAIVGNGVSNIVVDGLDVRGVAGIAGLIYFYKTSGIAKNNIVRNCTIPYTNLQAIYFYNQTASIAENNVISNAWNGITYAGAGAGGCGGYQAYSQSVTYFSTGCIFRRNTVTNCYVGAIPGRNGSKDGRCYSNIFIRNMVNNIDSYANNMPDHPTLIYNNTIWHRPRWDSGHGIAVQSGASQGTKIKNNVVYCDFTGTNTNVQAICLEYNTANDDVDYNLYYLAPGSTADIGKLLTGTYSTIALWKEALASSNVIGKDAHSLNADPKFISPSTGDFHLQSTSPLINAGVVIP